MIKVSILMYVKNGMPYFERAMKSVLTQTLSEIEILVIDGGSTDGTLELVYENQKKDERIRLLHCEYGSVGAQFNLGVREAKGEYIGIVESDDYILPDMYKTEYQYAREKKCDVLRADNYIFFDISGWEFKVRTRVSHDNSTYGCHLTAGQDDERIQIGGSYWTGLYKRSFLLKHHILMNESKGAAYQDFGFLFLVSAMAKSLYFLDEAFYCYRKDNPKSSCNRPRDIYVFHSEYAFLKKELISRDLWEDLKDYYYLWKIRNGQWFYHNLNKEDQECFASYLYKELRNDFDDLCRLNIKWNRKEQVLIEQSKGSQNDFNNYLKDCEREWELACDKLSHLNEKTSVYIFGAGNVGKIMCEYLLKKKITIKAYMDNNVNLWGTKKDHIMVISPEQVTLKQDERILICSENYADEIREVLLRKGNDRSCMIVCNDMDACIHFVMREMKG